MTTRKCLFTTSRWSTKLVHTTGEVSQVTLERKLEGLGVHLKLPQHWVSLYSPSLIIKEMRIQLLTKNFTKAERRFGGRLKREKISFKTKVVIGGREVD